MKPFDGQAGTAFTSVVPALTSARQSSSFGARFAGGGVQAAGFCGIILSGGASRRMGQPKALLAVAGRTLLEHHAALLAGASEVLLVTGAHHQAVTEFLASRPGARVRVVFNPRYPLGQLSSLQAGLAALADPALPVVLLPVDVPPLGGLDLTPLLDALRAPGVVAAVAACGGRDGHPVALSAVAARAVAGLDPAQSLREWLAGQGAAVVRVETGQPPVLGDLDTPQDLERLLRAGGTP
jgi:CTP:molybdopterin cytidylyltransferase MocA